MSREPTQQSSFESRSFAEQQNIERSIVAKQSSSTCAPRSHTYSSIDANTVNNATEGERCLTSRSLAGRKVEMISAGYLSSVRNAQLFATVSTGILATGKSRLRAPKKSLRWAKNVVEYDWYDVVGRKSKKQLMWEIDM